MIWVESYTRLSELHWHTTAEWAIVLQGYCQVTAVTPDGQNFIDTVVRLSKSRKQDALKLTFELSRDRVISGTSQPVFLTPSKPRVKTQMVPNFCW